MNYWKLAGLAALCISAGISVAICVAIYHVVEDM